MAPHPERITEALHVLATKDPVWPFTGSCTRALELVGANADFRAIPVIARFASSHLREVRLAAGHALDRLVHAMAPDHVPALDAAMRGGFYGAGAWPALQPDEVARLASAQHATSLLSIASMHRNGRVREAAVHRLVDRDGGEALPFLLWRTGDWVEPVRAAASAAVRARIAPQHAVRFWSCADLIARLDASARADRTWLAPCCDLLFRDECRDAARAARQAPERRRARRCIYGIAARSGSPVAGAATAAALEDSDPATRAWACSWLLSRVERHIASSAATRAATDRSAAVRRAALRALAELDPESAATRLEAALLDPRASLRAVARFYLASRGVEVRQRYLRALDTVSLVSLRAALDGIGEAGAAGDAGRAAAHLGSPAPSVRAAAVRAVGRLDRDGHVPALVDLLSDASAGVSRAAADALRHAAAMVPRDALVAALEPSRPQHVRRNALRVVMHLGKWDRLVHLLQLSRDAADPLAGAVLAGLRSWSTAFNRVPQLPAAGTARVAAHALADATALPRELAAELGSILRSVSPQPP